jgi:hypothetical protein
VKRSATVLVVALAVVVSGCGSSSRSVLDQGVALADELDGYTMTKSSLHFPVDRPLPKPLVK